MNVGLVPMAKTTLSSTTWWGELMDSVRFHMTLSRFHTNSLLWQFMVRELDLAQMYNLTYREGNFRKANILGFFIRELFFIR